MNNGGIDVDASLAVDNSGQRFVVDFDQIQCVAGYVGTFSNDDGDRLSLVPGDVRCHGPATYNFRVFQNACNWELGGAGCVKLGASYHRSYTGQVQGDTCVDAADTGVGMRTPKHHHHHSVAGQNVAGVATLTLYQAKVFLSAHRRADHLFVTVSF